MLNILVYGGCHALVLRDLIDEMFAAQGVETSLVINFELIAAGRPFPNDLLDRCDVLLYSPIENKADYNTDVLLARCAGKRVICFPWMEWHGYCPGAVKGTFKGRFQWFYPELLDIAGRFDRFGRFFDHVVRHFPDDETIDRTFETSTHHLASAERRHDMAVRIADHIATHYRGSRLFLISDHPCLSLYLHVLAQVAAILGLTLPAASDEPRREPQWRWRTPILPRVAQRLGLAFDDTDWVDDELLADRTFGLETYLSLYYHRDSVILGPVGPARLEFGTTGDAAEVDAGTRIFASPVPDAAAAEREAYICHRTLAGLPGPLQNEATFRIDPTEWRATWHF